MTQSEERLDGTFLTFVYCDKTAEVFTEMPKLFEWLV